MPKEIGTVTYIGTETVTLGPTSLQVYKYRLNPSDEFKSKTGVKLEEVWFALLPGDKFLCIRVAVTTDEDVSVYEISSITFTKQ